jgi:hypothetical protein
MSRKDFTLQVSINISDLLLDEGNPRIRSAKDQPECIARVLRKEKQMLNLIKSIAKEGLSTIPILITPSQKIEGKWVVKDGNRRMTALKLLNDHLLCVNEDLRQQIKTIATESGVIFENTVDCYSSNDPNAIAREVKLRHSGALEGVGQLDWSAYLRTVYELNNELATDYKRAGQYLLWAEDHGINVDDDFPISTVHRFFSVDNIGLLGFKISDDNLTITCEEHVAVRMAQEIIGDLGTGRKKVDDLFTGDAAKIYLNQIRKNAGLSLQSPAVNSTPSNLRPQATANTPGSASIYPSNALTIQSPIPTTTMQLSATGNIRGGRKPSKPNWDRKKLFWAGATQPALSVGASPIAEKMRTIFYEIAQIKDVRESTLTVAFLIRAMIELSEKQFRTANSLQDKNVLADNIAAACDAMLNKSLLNRSQVDLVKSYTVTKRSEVGIFTVDTLQKYLHRETHKPTAQTINTFWDELHPFVHACWK